MAYVIAEPCIGTKDTACVDACPVDCIHPKKDRQEFAEEEMIYIDPVECIDCGACVPVCPVSAIFRARRPAGKVERLHRAQRQVLRALVRALNETRAHRAVCPFLCAWLDGL